jgi:hypothetical protein
MGVFEDLAKSAESPRIPDNTRLIEAIGDAEIGSGDAYSNMFTALTDARDAFSDRRSDAFIAQLNTAPDKAARDAMLTDKLSGFNMLNPKMLNEAMAKAETRDLARSADQLARDTFGLEQKKFAETKEENIQDTINKINDRAMLQNQFGIEQDLKQEEFDAKQIQTAFLNAAATSAVTREIAKTAEVNRITNRKETREDKLITRKDEQWELGKNLRELTLKANEATQKISLRKSKKSEEDIAVIQPATEALLKVITNPDSTVTQNATAVRAFSKAVGGRPIGKETRDLIKTVLTRAQGLELDEFNEGYNVIDDNPDSPTFGTSETQRLLLKVMNDTRGTKYTALSGEGQATQKDFTAQVEKNFIKALSKLQSKHLKGRQTARESRPAAAEVLADNVEISTVFAAQKRAVKSAVDLEIMDAETVTEIYGADNKTITRYAEDPNNAIPDTVTSVIKKIHGKDLTPVATRELKVIVRDATKKIQSAVNYSKIKSAKARGLINVAISKYLSSIVYYPIDVLNWGKDFQIANQDVEDMDSHELLNGLQLDFPPTSPNGELILGAIALGEDTTKDTTKDKSASEESEAKIDKTGWAKDIFGNDVAPLEQRIAGKKQTLKNIETGIKNFKEKFLPPQKELDRRRKTMIKGFSQDPRVRASQMKKLEELDKIKRFFGVTPPAGQ